MVDAGTSYAVAGGAICNTKGRTGFGLRVVTTEVTTLHHEQFVDGVVNRRVQTLRQRGRLVRRGSVVRVGATLMAAILTTATLVLAYIEASFRSVQRQIAAAEALARVAWVCI